MNPAQLALVVACATPSFEISSLRSPVYCLQSHPRYVNDYVRVAPFWRRLHSVHRKPRLARRNKLIWDHYCHTKVVFTVHFETIFKLALQMFCEFMRDRPGSFTSAAKQVQVMVFSEELAQRVSYLPRYSKTAVVYVVMSILNPPTRS